MAAMSDWRSMASYGLRFGITMTLAGAVAVQLRELANGRDLRPMDSMEFWGAAALYGGGFGMVGDLLKIVTEPVLGKDGLAVWLAGPAAETFMNVTGVPVTAARQLMYDPDALDAGAEPNTGRAGIRVLRSELPGGSIWYLRAALNRMLIDQLQEEIDPDYRDAWRRMERRAEDRDQEYFWEPGEMLPGRAPDIDNALPAWAQGQGETLQ
jgi:hypothetical protein